LRVKIKKEKTPGYILVVSDDFKRTTVSSQKSMAHIVEHVFVDIYGSQIYKNVICQNEKIIHLRVKIKK
jgi:hypothetical protein